MSSSLFIETKLRKCAGQLSKLALLRLEQGVFLRDDQRLLTDLILQFSYPIRCFSLISYLRNHPRFDWTILLNDDKLLVANNTDSRYRLIRFLLNLWLLRILLLVLTLIIFILLHIILLFCSTLLWFIICIAAWNNAARFIFLFFLLIFIHYPINLLIIILLLLLIILLFFIYQTLHSFPQRTSIFIHYSTISPTANLLN